MLSQKFLLTGPIRSKGTKVIDMLKWEEIDPSAKLIPAFSFTINCGIIDDPGNWIDLPTRIYVDDTLMLALDVDHMKMVLAVL
jgi:hypothetical protein